MSFHAKEESVSSGQKDLWSPAVAPQTKSASSRPSLSIWSHSCLSLNPLSNSWQLVMSLTATCYSWQRKIDLCQCYSKCNVNTCSKSVNLHSLSKKKKKVKEKSVLLLVCTASERGFMTLQFYQFYTRLLLVILYSKPLNPPRQWQRDGDCIRGVREGINQRRAVFPNRSMGIIKALSFFSPPPASRRSSLFLSPCTESPRLRAQLLFLRRSCHHPTLVCSSVCQALLKY